MQDSSDDVKRAFWAQKWQSSPQDLQECSDDNDDDLDDTDIKSALQKLDVAMDESQAPVAMHGPQEPTDLVQKELEEHFEKASQGSTGSTGEDATVAELTKALQDLKLQLSHQSSVMEQQSLQIQALKEAPAPAARSTKPPENAEASTKEADEPERPSFEAAKQRLRRMCKVKANGKVSVPDHVLTEWNKQGSARTALVTLFLEKNCQEDHTTIVGAVQHVE